MFYRILKIQQIVVRYTEVRRKLQRLWGRGTAATEKGRLLPEVQIGTNRRILAMASQQNEFVRMLCCYGCGCKVKQKVRQWINRRSNWALAFTFNAMIVNVKI